MHSLSWILIDIGIDVIFYVMVVLCLCLSLTRHKCSKELTFFFFFLHIFHLIFNNKPSFSTWLGFHVKKSVYWFSFYLSNLLLWKLSIICSKQALTVTWLVWKAEMPQNCLLIIDYWLMDAVYSVCRVTDANVTVSGMGKEVENLLTENKQLLETK